jgi:hypothetical protein
LIEWSVQDMFCINPYATNSEKCGSQVTALAVQLSLKGPANAIGPAKNQNEKTGRVSARPFQELVNLQTLNASKRQFGPAQGMHADRRRRIDDERNMVNRASARSRGTG